ncbi:MAG: HAD family hydrolase [Candidatus Aminicenantales bacterium]
MIRALILDMDGLMVDSERLYFQTEREMARKFHKNVEDKTLWEMMGRSPLESMEIFVWELGLPISAEEALEIRNRIMRKKLLTELKPMPGLHHIIDTFSGKLKMAVCTGAQKEFLEIVVRKLGIRNRFDVLQSSEEVTKGKPHPEIYLKTCSRLKLSPKDCVVVEDSSNGALAGKRAGCYVIAVPSEYTKEQDFHFVDFIAEDLFQAAEHIKVLLKNFF